MTFLEAIKTLEDLPKTKITRKQWKTGFLKLDDDGYVDAVPMFSMNVKDFLATDWGIHYHDMKFQSALELLKVKMVTEVRRRAWMNGLRMYEQPNGELIIESSETHKKWNLSIEDTRATDWEVVK